jgi:hypothetical protein
VITGLYDRNGLELQYGDRVLFDDDSPRTLICRDGMTMLTGWLCAVSVGAFPYFAKDTLNCVKLSNDDD